MKTLLNEIWVHIFTFLNPLQLVSTIAPVCKLFYELSSEEQIWKQFVGNDAWVASQIEKYNDKQSLNKTKIIIGKSKIFSKKLYCNWLSNEISTLLYTSPSVLNAIDNVSWLMSRPLKISFLDPDSDSFDNILNSSKIPSQNMVDFNFNVDGETVAVQIKSVYPYYTRNDSFDNIDYTTSTSDAIVFFRNTWELELNTVQTALGIKPEIYIVVITELAKQNRTLKNLKQQYPRNIDFFDSNESENVLQDIVNHLRRELKARLPRFSPTKTELCEILTRNGCNLSK